MHPPLKASENEVLIDWINILTVPNCFYKTIQVDGRSGREAHPALLLLLVPEGRRNVSHGNT
jgi:hypothetical protein